MAKIAGVRKGTWLKSEIVPDDCSDMIRDKQHEKEKGNKPRPSVNQAVYALLREGDKLKKEVVK